MPAYRGAALSFAVLFAGACARPSHAPLAPAAGAAGCLLAPASSAGAAAPAPLITVALTDSVDPTHVPVGRNDAERLVFRPLYETLVRFDCEGRAVPALAESWTSSEGGRRWAFTLRADAQFWDGAPVTSRDVVVGKGGAGYTLTPIDARIVGVWLARGSDEVPRFLADAALAVMKAAPSGDWPIGTGRHWVTGATATPQEIRAYSSAGDTLLFRLTSGKDPRDLLDAGVDLLVTRDRSVTDYAATQPAFTVVELPWDRIYVYAAAEPPTIRLDGLEQSVRGEARRAQGGGGGFWWEDLQACGPPPVSTPPASGTAPRRIAYVRGDPAARDLAGRIAALGGGTASGQSLADFSRSLTAGTAAGYVLALPRAVPDACRAARDLLPPWPVSVAPLVETRARDRAASGSVTLGDGWRRDRARRAQMTFRTRLLAGFGVVVLVPLAVIGLGIRREMSGRVAAEYERRVGALAEVIRADVARQSEGIAARLRALKGAVAGDNRFRVAVIQGGDRAYVLDYAGDAMRVAGLDFLQVVDAEGHVVSSGHFRNEYDRSAPIPHSEGPALVRARTAEGPFLALVRTDSLRLGGRRLTLLGGTRVDSLFLSRLARDPELAVSVVLPGDSLTPDSSGQVVVQVPLPYVETDGAPGSGGDARIVVTHSQSLIAALRRNVNMWFAVAVLVTALAVVLMAGWLSTRLSRPMTEMERRVVMGDLARQVNHDIKNGLAPLRNVFRHFAQVAQREPANLPRVFGERQSTVESSIGYLETLAANYARLYPQASERPTDVNAVVREALRRVAGADHAELRTELPDRLPLVRVDALALRRVIENLLGNAVDSLQGKPGAVTIATEGGGNGLVRLSVSDTGHGMTKAEVDRAFDDFYTTKPGGTGLGLSIVRRLVLDANGTLKVESEQGKGSTFIVELPTEGGGRGAS